MVALIAGFALEVKAAPLAVLAIGYVALLLAVL